MAHLAYLKLGNLKGAAIIKAADRLEHIPVLSFTHKVASQTDVLGQLQVADRRHNPAVFTKHIDYSTPNLREAHGNRVVFPTAQLNFFHMPKSGPEKNYLSMKFTDVSIMGIKMVMPSTLDPAASAAHEYEEVTFIYKSIEWSHTPATGGTLEAGLYMARSIEDKKPVFAQYWYDEAMRASMSKVTDMYMDMAKAQVTNAVERLKHPDPEPQK
ncbi:MAG TPA: type VI secretion system tube protein TssD [Planctomycetota bacterium]|nr:type VI secretion system tube protein TssD [Planctomycetota bacterium]